MGRVEISIDRFTFIRAFDEHESDSEDVIGAALGDAIAGIDIGIAREFAVLAEAIVRYVEVTDKSPDLDDPDESTYKSAKIAESHLIDAAYAVIAAWDTHDKEAGYAQ